jgi:hypothetical protein
MLNVPAPFPHPGSYALHAREGRTHLVRIQYWNIDGLAVISFPLVRDVASGTCTVPREELLDGTPLTPAERAEMDRLIAHNSCLKRPKGRSVDRAAVLASRDHAALIMAPLLARVPDPTKRGSREAVAA